MRLVTLIVFLLVSLFSVYFFLFFFCCEELASGLDCLYRWFGLVFFSHFFPLCFLLRCIISWGLGFLICSLVCPTTLPTCCVAVVSFIRTCTLTDSFRFNFLFFYYQISILSAMFLLSFVSRSSVIIYTSKQKVSFVDKSLAAHARTYCCVTITIISFAFPFSFSFLFESRPSQISF